MTSAPSTNIWAQSHASKARRRPACCTTIASKSRQYKVQTCREGRPPRRPYKKRQEIRRQALGPGEAVFGERQGTDALAGNGKDGVAHGRENRRKGRFAEASGGIVGLEEMDFDFRGHLVH